MNKTYRMSSVMAGMAVSLACLQVASAQLLEPVTNATPDSASATETAQTLDDVYRLTRAAKSTDDFANITACCQTLLVTGISDKDRQYLNSLIAWSENRCAEKFVRNSASMLQLGLTEQGNEQLRLAISKYEHVIVNHPLTWRAWMGRAVLHAQHQEYELALNKFQRVLKLNSRCRDARFNCAEIQYQLRQYELSIADYSRLIEDDPTDCLARTGRGHCHFKMGDCGKAIIDYQTVIDLYPENATALCNAADALVGLERWSEARDRYESAIKHAANGLACRQLAGFHLKCTDQKIADPRKSVALIQQAMEKDGSTPDDLKILAAAYRATGQFQLAEQTLTGAKDP